MATIVLVHGAFADSAIWSGVIDLLLAAGQRVVAVANPLRGLAGDASAVDDVVRWIDGPVVLVGHGYGGAVITNVGAGGIVGLVYVAGFAAAEGESCFSLAEQFPGSTLADSLEAVLRDDDTSDLSIVPERFHGQFAADLAGADAARMAVTQRPIARAALLEPSGPRPLWRELPTWFAIAGRDRGLPANAQRYMAERAGAWRIAELAGASHAVAVSHPETVAELILEASGA